MGRTRKTNKGYRFNDRTKAGRNIEVVFDHLPGKRISTGTRDMAEAVLFAENYLRNEGVPQDVMPLLEDFARDFYTRRDRASIWGRHNAFHKTNREQWYHLNQRFLEMYILPRFGRYHLDAINPVVVEYWIADLKGTNGKVMSGSARSKILTALSYIMDDAVRMGYVRDNPCRLSLAPSRQAENPRRSLTIDEQEKLFPSDIGERIRVWGSVMWTVYFSIMFDTGFRPDEVAGLQLQDIYSTQGGMAVYTSHTMNKEEHRPKDRVKTSGKGVERRVGLLSGITEELVLRLVEEDRITDAEEYLFLVRRKDKRSWVFPDTANKHFKLVVGRELESGDNLTQYCIRHTYATMRRGSMDERILAVTMGHKGGVRDDYDHREAALVIEQLERSRADIFRRQEEPDVVPLSKKIR